MKLSNIYIYPLKSSKAIKMDFSEVLTTGLANDRTMAAIGESNKVITGREFPALTSITATVSGNTLKLAKHGRKQLEIALPIGEKANFSFKLFRNTVEGIKCDDAASEWLSDVLGINCSLAYIDSNFRQIDTKRGGKIDDRFAYADASPIHLITEESLGVLNSIMKKNVSELNFRPNLVVKGGKAFDEDSWKSIVINDCVFEVHYKCERCIFTTVNPATFLKDEEMQPLATLAKFRRNRKEPLTFGVYLVPRKTGSISIGDDIQVKK